MRMITGRGTMAVDCVLVTEKMTIGDQQYSPGDLLVSDGSKTWGMKRDEWPSKIRGARMDPIRKAAESLSTNGVL